MGHAGRRRHGEFRGLRVRDATAHDQDGAVAAGARSGESKVVLVGRVDESLVGLARKSRAGDLGPAAGHGLVRRGDPRAAIGAEPVARRQLCMATRAGGQSSVRGRIAFARST